MLVVAAMAATVLLAQQQPSFRVDVRLVRLLATVRDSGGHPVGGLAKEEFQIDENGVPQELAVFEYYTETPVSVVLLVDTSASTGQKLKQETQSVLRFLDAVFRQGNPGDMVSLYSFNHDVAQRTGFTRRASRLEKELKKLESEAGTSLYDAIYFAARALESRPGRRVIVIISDGADTTSSKSFDDALKAVHAADAAIYGVIVVPVASDPGRHVAGENALIALATTSGGRVFSATLADMLDSAFASILRDLRSQYLLGYYPRNVPYTRDTFHRIAVRVRRPDLRVVTRTGYYYEEETRSRSGSEVPTRNP
jgi:Ca-activated chloride channel family protein